MTIGSAALLPGMTPQAPLSPFHDFRRDRRPAMRPGAGAAPPWRLPVAGLADDPPRGRILIVEDETAIALDLQGLLRKAGFRTVGPAASLDEAERLMTQPAIDAAVVDLQLPGGAAPAIADRLAQRGIPFVWLTDTRFDAPPHDYGEVPAVPRSAARGKLVAALERAISGGQHARMPMPEQMPEQIPGCEPGLYPVPPPQTVWPRVFPQL